MHKVDIHVFLHDAAARPAVEQVLTDRRLAKTRASYHQGGLAAAAATYENEPSPGLLIIESHDAPAEIFAQLEQLSEMCRPETELILLGVHNDVALYRQLARRGIREYIPAPVDPAQLLDAVLTVCTGGQDIKQGRVIAFIGASGGVGSSTIAGNVAFQLAKVYDDEAALVDLDLAFGTVGLDFNMDSPQTAAQALAQAERLDDQMIERFLVRHSDNLALLTAPADGDTGSDVDAAAVDRLIETLRRNAAWVALDLPHSWSGWVRHVLDAADDIVITAVPTLASLRNAKIAADALNARRRNDAPVRIVLNHVGGAPKTDIPTKDFAGTLGVKPTILVPHEPGLFAQAANSGRPLGELSRAQRVLDPLAHLATTVSARPRPDRRGRAGTPDLLRRLVSWSVRPMGHAAS
jgi:pilus assembly protein CpaE